MTEPTPMHMQVTAPRPAATGQAHRLFDEAFAPSTHRTPRSAPYRAGVLSILKFKLEGQRLEAVPYAVGSAEADAYFSGQDEGHRIVRGLQ